MAQLAEALAHEVYRHVSNRSSLQAAFAPADLVKVVQAYARMQIADGTSFSSYRTTSQRMAYTSCGLDAQCGLVVPLIHFPLSRLSRLSLPQARCHACWTRWEATWQSASAAGTWQP